MSRRLIILILITALAIRLAYALAQDPLLPYESTGGDTRWYLANARALVTDAPPGSAVNGIATDIRALGQPPVYFIFTGLPQVWFDPAGAIIFVRIVQVLMSTATCYFAYRIAYLLVNGGLHKGDPPGRPYNGDLRATVAGLIAAAALAFSPAFFMEAAVILTETLFIFFAAAGIWLYIEAMAREERRTTLLIIAGVMLGLATLTRAVFLLFPLSLVIYWMMVRLGWRRAVLLLAAYVLLVSTWTVYNLARWNRLVIAGEGLFAFLYVGATGWDDPEAVDQRLRDAQATEEANPQQQDFTQAAGDAITSDIPGYIRRRVSELAGAYLQPHGTLFFTGESLRDLTANWLRDDRSLSGLIALTQGNSFWQKLLLYVLHYTALILGLIGMWRTRRNWRIALPMIGFILYTTLIHLFLLALPRYIFPTLVFWWVFAAAGMVGMSNRTENSNRQSAFSLREKS